MISGRLPQSSLFHYTTLFRSEPIAEARHHLRNQRADHVEAPGDRVAMRKDEGAAMAHELLSHRDTIDRKSTRLNSSHVSISYAVFCLKKKILGRGVIR